MRLGASKLLPLLTRSQLNRPFTTALSNPAFAGAVNFAAMLAVIRQGYIKAETSLHCSKAPPPPLPYNLLLA